ncbi:MAG: small multi-drug export protein [Candidatus Aerophobetes bacterium]|nr:small multi-drug export protein [Candidatus Aerophobetes bacterium]
MSNLFLRPEVITFFISMLPISELRGALPFALSQGLSPMKAYFISVAGNILPVLPLLLFLEKIWKLLQSYKGEKIINWMRGRAGKREGLVKRYGFGGLIILVSIPLPITGAWTGTLVSFLLCMRVKYAFSAICIGVCLAGIIVLLVSLGVMEGVKFFL